MAMLGAMLAVLLMIATASVCSRGQQQVSACERYLTKGCECQCQRESTSRSKSQECYCRSSSIMIEEEGGSGCIMELEECCDELESMEEQCRCDTINKIVQQKHYYGPSGILGEANKLPLTCGFTQSPCSIIRL